ncbi:MAG: phosphodiester glycosidase family protein [Desulfovibrionales bacterium]
MERRADPTTMMKFLKAAPSVAPSNALPDRTSPSGMGGKVLLLIFLMCVLPEDLLAWEPLAPGLSLEQFQGTLETRQVPVTALRIDPAYYSLTLLTASEQKSASLSLKQWAARHGLVAAINASMYQDNYTASTGYMKNFDHNNNPSINSRFGAFLVFNPKQEDLPPVRIIDRQHHPDWRELIAKYNTVVQNYRMISAAGANLWPASDQRFPVAAIGMDTSGNILFLYCPVSISVHELNRIVLDLPLSLTALMYAEGGPVAGLYIDPAGLENGSTARQSVLFEGNSKIYPVPNVLGIVPRK